MSALDLNAKHYQNNSSIQLSIAEDLFKLHSFNGNEAILDIGCGDGKVSALLAEKVPHGFVDAFDPSASMIELASDIFPKSKFSNLTFFEGSAEDFSTPKKYDLITACCSIYWSRDQRKAFELIAKHLKPGGKVLLNTFPKESEYWQAMHPTLQNDTWFSYDKHSIFKHFLSTKDYESIIDSLKLKKLHFEKTHHIATYENAQAIKDYVKGWLPCMAPLPEKLQEEFLEDLSLDLQKKFYNASSQQIEIPYQKLVIYLVKA